MARIARVVAAGVPHHVTQRGNRRLRTFFCEGDYAAYLGLMGEWCDRCGVEVWAYCLMPNHVHLVVVPQDAGGLARAVGEAHRRYTRMVNFRKRWRGHLWQGRFASYAMDERYLLAAARYIESNPVRAGLAKCAWQYRWSSAKAHVKGKDDVLVRVRALLELVGDWRGFLRERVESEEAERLRSHERTGRPLGEEDFVTGLEKALGRQLRRLKPGPKPKAKRTHRS
jgi:putative transposase